MSRVRTSHSPDGWRIEEPATPHRPSNTSVAYQVGEMQPLIRHDPPRKKPKVEA